MGKRLTSIAGAAAMMLMQTAASAQGAAVAPPQKSGRPASKPKKEEALPTAPARMWLIAPSPARAWTLRIDNEGSSPMRIAADVRLLRLEIETGGKRQKRVVRCAAPAALKPSGFPEGRGLLLPPGHSYIEEFDPRLLCFGKDAAALQGGVVVKAKLGWPAPRWSKKQSPPFAVESTEDPPAFAPAVEIAAPAIVLSYADDARKAPRAARPVDEASRPAPADHAPEPDASPDHAAGSAPPPGDPTKRVPIADANAPRLELTAEPFADAVSPRALALHLKARNAGKRSMNVAIRSRMLELRVRGPGGDTVCAAAPPTGSVPRDMFRSLKPGGTVDLAVLVTEACPHGTFQQEGLYRITAALHATEPGEGLKIEVYTAVVTAEGSTLARVQSAPQPFYTSAPEAVSTPVPIAEEAESPEAATF